ncbi:MAG: iron ABC transporter permease [Pseudomonadota bacterium]
MNVTVAQRPTSRHYLPARTALMALVVLLPCAILLAICIGAVALPVLDTLSALLSVSEQGQTTAIVLQIRLPRALLAALVGALLGVSGAATQGLFRNPLADPSLIGVTGGAVFGASLAIVLGGSNLLGFAGLSLVAVGAFLGGALAVVMVYRLATTEMGTSVTTMLLAGIAITALAGSFSNFLEFIASNEMLRRISLWKMGGLDGANHARVMLAAAVCLITMVFLPRHAQALNALLLGESEARHLGIDVGHVKRWLILLVAAAVGSSVALAGTIAFVGLIVPHIMRLMIGPDHRYLLWASALAGAILLPVADVFARVIIAPTELPVGMVTAAIGAPFFILLLRRGPKQGPW